MTTVILKYLKCGHVVPSPICAVCICQKERVHRIFAEAHANMQGIPVWPGTHMEQQGIEDRTEGKRRWHKVNHFMDSATIDEDILKRLKEKQQFNEQNRDAESKLEIWKYILVLAAACVLAWILHYSFLRGI